MPAGLLERTPADDTDDAIHNDKDGHDGDNDNGASSLFRLWDQLIVLLARAFRYVVQEGHFGRFLL